MAEQDQDPTSATPPGEGDRDPSFPTFLEYEVFAKLGGGGFGGVYKCRRRSGGGIVAIKVPHNDPLSIEIFNHELDLVLRLPPHPNVVGVISAATAQLASGRTVNALVMEWVRDARPIDAYVEWRGLPIRDRLALLSTVASGLDHLHMNGVVHRDLKPANVLVADDGRCVIVDLGGARERLDRSESPSLMTIAYASPEQLDAVDTDTLDQRSDIYSFGKLMAAVMLGGDIHTVPGVPTRDERVRFAREWSIDRLQQHPRWPGREVADLIAQMTERDRVRRDIRADTVKRSLDQIVRPFALKVDHVVRRVFANQLLRTAVAMCVSVAGGITLAIALINGYARLGIGPPVVLPSRVLTSLDDVVIVELRDDSIRAAAARLDPPADQSSGANRRRHLFAKVIERSAQLKASCVVIDAMLPDNPDALTGTNAIASAISAVGVTMPVVTAVYEGWCTTPDAEILATALQPLVQAVGSMDSHQDTGAGALFNVSFEREGHRPALGLPAAAVAAHLRATVALEPRWLSIGWGSVEFRTPWEGRSGGGPRRTELDWIGTSGALPQIKPSPGPQPGDLTGLISIAPASVPELCKESCIAIDTFLDPAHTEELRNRMHGKIVVVWWIGPPEKRDVHETAKGSGVFVPGGWNQAVAIQALLSMPPHSPSIRTLTVMLVVAAVVGAIAAMMAHRFRQRRHSGKASALLAAVVGIAVISIVAQSMFQSAGIDFRLALIALALLAAMSIMLAIMFVSGALSDASTHHRVHTPTGFAHSP